MSNTNVLLITVDALRADHLQQYGYDRETMPVLDRLADSGTMFTNAYANGPYTRISVPALQTSRYLAYDQLESLTTLPDVLNAGGITTAMIGTQTGMDLVEGSFGYAHDIDLGRDDFHKEANRNRPIKERAVSSINEIATVIGDILDQSGPVYRGLNGIYRRLFSAPGFRYLGYTGAERVTDRAIDWIETHGNDPFFLWVHYMEGHRPYGVHDSHPKYLDEPLDENVIRRLMKQAGTAPETVSDAQRSVMKNAYDSDLAYCDRHIGRLFDAMTDLDLWTSTDIVFTSDHGEEFYEHGKYFHRNLPYDELLHVPLIIKTGLGQEDIIEGQRELIDVAPTICDRFGISSDDTGFLGKPLFEGEDRRLVAVGSQGKEQNGVAGRWDDWKYIQGDSETYLFDLAADPGETRSVADEHPDIVNRFERQIPNRIFDRRPEAFDDPTEEAERERLEALGYLEVSDE